MGNLISLPNGIFPQAKNRSRCFQRNKNTRVWKIVVEIKKIEQTLAEQCGSLFASHLGAPYLILVA